MRGALLVWLAVAAVGCGPKVEGPFEGEGHYEGEYDWNESPRGWREDGREPAGQQARRDERRSPPGWAADEPDGAPDQRQARRDDRNSPPGWADEDEVGTMDERQARRDEIYGEELDEVEVEVLRPRVSADLRQDLVQLRAHAARFESSRDLEHLELVAALRDLARIVRATPGAGASDGHARQIDTYAAQIERSPAASLRHSDWTKAALGQGVTALTSAARAMDDPDLDARIETLREQVDALDAQTTLMDQRQEYGAALEKLADLYVEVNRPAASFGTQ